MQIYKGDKHMKKIRHIGLVIADVQEYEPVNVLCKKLGGIISEQYGDKLSVFEYEKDGNSVKISAVLCGIGKVNAAAATAYLISSEGCDAIINSGLSGGISSVRRGDYTVGTEYIEHDFDVSPLGYKRGIKPDQDCYIYQPDKALFKAYEKINGIISGVMVCGDQFIGSDEAKKQLKSDFKAVSCDMESAACASVCHKAKVPFVAVRRISDDAGDMAADSYTEMNNLAEDKLINVVFMGIDNILNL